SLLFGSARKTLSIGGHCNGVNPFGFLLLLCCWFLNISGAGAGSGFFLKGLESAGALLGEVVRLGPGSCGHCGGTPEMGLAMREGGRGGYIEGLAILVGGS